MFSMALENEPRLETIMVTSGTIQYIAEAAPESSHTAAVWRLTRIQDVDASTKIIKVKKALYAPGTNGAGLAAIWGD